MAAPRRRASAPSPANSTSDHPSPRPRISRPWLSSWTVAASSARRSGWCNGARMTPVPSSIRDVAWAIAAPTTRSEGMYPSSTKWCSVVQTDVKPSRSASTARPTVSS